MKVIAALAIVGILLLQISGAIPVASVGGPVVIGSSYFAAGLAVGVHEAWTNRRGPLGWIVNLLLTFLGVLLAAPIGGAALAMLLTPLSGGRSLAAQGGPLMALALAGGMAVALASAWGVLWLVNRWRKSPPTPTR